jgi:hypothetical protein
MATITWTGAAGDSTFATPSNWQGDVAPGANDQADITIAVSNFAVVTTSDTIDMLALGGGGILAIAGGAKLDLLGDVVVSTFFGNFNFPGIGISTNTSTIALAGGATLEAVGTLTNSGVVSESGVGGASSLLVGTLDLVLDGGGHVTLSDAGSATANIIGVTAATLLTNVDNTIAGAGQIGAGRLTLNNSGTINATGTHALVLNTGANTITNSGLFSAIGAGGMTVDSPVDNSGTFAVADGSAIRFGAGVGFADLTAGTLTAGTWQVVDGGHGAELALPAGLVSVGANIVLSGTGAVLLTGGTPLEATLTGIAAGGELDLLGARDFTAANTLANAGTVVLAGGTLTAPGFTIAAGGLLSGAGTLAAPLTDNGTVMASGGTLVVAGAITGGGTLQIGTGAALELQNGGAATIDFADNAGMLQLDVPNSFAGAIDGLAAGDTIALAGLDGVAATLNGSTLTVDLLDGSTRNFAVTTAAAGVYATANFNGGGTDVTIACFRSGTRILTRRGLVAVEDLRVGEPVPILLGRRLARIAWIGHRRIDCTRHPRPEDVWPVRVCRDAFAPGVPARDLDLSPDHAVYLPAEPDGVLVPIRHLLNGASIAQVKVDEVVYWHVELDRHDVLLAEGLPAESYLDTGNRAAFANGGPVVAVTADFAPGRWDDAACATLAVGGPAVDAARARLAARLGSLGFTRTPDADPHLVVDGVRLAPSACETGARVFDLPAGARAIRLRSRSAVPTQMASAGAGDEDHRRLGICVTAVTVDSGGGWDIGAGWHRPESCGRWTDGDGILIAPGARRIRIAFVPLAAYWLPPAVIPECPTPLTDRAREI